MRAFSYEHFEQSLGIWCDVLPSHLVHVLPSPKISTFSKGTLVPLIEILYLGSTWALDGIAFYELQNSQSFFDQEFDKVENVCLSWKLLDYQSKLFSNGFLVSLLDNTRLRKECNKKILEALSAKKVTNSHSLFFLHILYQLLNVYKNRYLKALE